MTREEQIIEAGVYHSCGRRPPKTHGHNMHELAYINRNLEFEAGAKWADETMLDKACEWLESMLRVPLGHYAAPEFVDCFRKAMTEEQL